MIAKNYENNVWDKQRVIEAYLELCDSKGNLPKIEKEDDLSWSIRKNRLKAVLKSQQLEYDDFISDFDVSKLHFNLTETEEDMCFDLEDDGNGFLFLISYTISDSMVSDLQTLLQDYKLLLNEWEMDIQSYPIRCAIFKDLFEYKMAINNLLHFGSDYLCCPPTMVVSLGIIEGINKKYFQNGADYIDQLLKLLMGDNFAQPITVDELIEKYGYPNVTDNKLQDIDIENF